MILKLLAWLSLSAIIIGGAIIVFKLCFDDFFHGEGNH